MDYYAHLKMADGHLNKCKDCVKKRIRQHRINHNDKHRTADTAKYHRRRAAGKIRTRVKDPLKQQANTAVGNAVRRGDLTRPDQCELCADSQSRIEAHHDDYKQQLAVRWICSICHHRVHSKFHPLQ
jgi:hypothetical protein|tara:strand:- start:59 stop:439 length:381 start_codon:yes stop_codon:yes gene_type:complete